MRSHAAYKRFVDELVDYSRIQVIAARIREYGHSERTNDQYLPLDQKELERKEMFQSLTASQREIIAVLLEEAQTSAIHDIASFLEHRLSSDGLKISWNGEDIPASPYASMHYDFVCRREGDDWPDEEVT